MLPVGLIVCALAVICIAQLVYKWINPKCNGILPPGSMGLPLIGETLQLMIPSSSLDLPPFIKRRMQRYGPIFRTSIGGRPVVVSADPDFNHFIFLQEGKLVKAWYLDTYAKLFKQGENVDGAYIHKYIRNITLSHFGAETLKEKLLPQLEKLVNTTLLAWSTLPCIEVKNAAVTMACDFGAKQLFSYDPERQEKLSDKYINLSQGLMSLPLNIPGTSYYRCLKDQKKLISIMTDVLNTRRSMPPENRPNDVLDHILQDMNAEKFINDDFIVNLLFGLLYVSFDSLSSTLALAMNLLAENPLALEALTAEHEGVVGKREGQHSSITWEEYKSMTFTHQVINETLRLQNGSPGLLRKARKDIHVNGYTIPRGWAIMTLTSALHLNPDTFENPLTFNPWRWKDIEPKSIYKNFAPFGGGMKQCAGSEYTRLFLSTFFHVLVTKYRMTKISGGDVVRGPMLRFRNGIHVNISKKT